MSSEPSIQGISEANSQVPGAHTQPAVIVAVLHQKAASTPAVQAALEELAQAGTPVDLQVTTEAGDAVNFTRAAALAGADIVLAGGGDGTLNEVVSGLMAAREECTRLPRLALLPLGTANDFARAAGIPLEASAALRLLFEAQAPWVDVGQVNERYFMNVATGGFAPEMTAETSDTLKHMFGSVAYALTGLARPASISARPGRLRGPGFAWEGEFLALAVGNAKQAGGGIVLTPDAVIDDGMFDVALLPQSDEIGLGDALKVLRESALDAVDEAVLRWRTPWLEVDAPDELCINLDGEPMRQRSFRFGIVPSAIQMLLPHGSCVIGQSP